MLDCHAPNDKGSENGEIAVSAFGLGADDPGKVLALKNLRSDSQAKQKKKPCHSNGNAKWHCG